MSEELREELAAVLRHYTDPHDAADAAIAYIRQHDDWQSIETAPKDGTRVHLKNRFSGLEDFGYWDSYAERGSLTGLLGEWDQEQGNGEMTHWKLAPPKEQPK